MSVAVERGGETASAETSPRERFFVAPFELGLALAWLALLVLAHREAVLLDAATRIQDPVEAFFFEANHTSARLHYVLFALILWSRRHAIRAALAAPRSLASGLPVLTVGLGLFAWARLSGESDLMIDAFVASLAGSALLVGGRTLLGVLALPLALVWLARPLPPPLVHHLHEFLQAATTDFAAWTLGLFSELARSGFMMSFQGRLFEVVENCSGLRIIQTLMMAALVYAELFSRSRVQSFGLLLLAPLVGFFVNGLRVDSIMLNPLAEQEAIHSGQGLAMIVGAVFLLAGLDRLGDHWLWPKGSRAWRSGRGLVAAAKGEEGARARAQRLVLASLCALGVALVGFSFSGVRVPSPGSAKWELSRIPTEIGLWKMTGYRELDARYFGSVRFDDKLIREYDRMGDRVTLMLVSDDRTRRSSSSYSPKTASLGSGWEMLKREPIALAFPPVAAERSIQGRGGELQLVRHFRLEARPLWRETLAWWLAFDRLPGAPAREIVSVRISTPIEDGDLEAAQTRLDGFSKRLTEHLRAAAPEGFVFPAERT